MKETWKLNSISVWFGISSQVVFMGTLGYKEKRLVHFILLFKPELNIKIQIKLERTVAWHCRKKRRYAWSETFEEFLLVSVYWYSIATATLKDKPMDQQLSIITNRFAWELSRRYLLQHTFTSPVLTPRSKLQQQGYSIYYHLGNCFRITFDLAVHIKWKASYKITSFTMEKLRILS